MTAADRDQRGSAVPLVLAATAVLATVAWLVAGVGGALIGQRKAEAAADLAALAGAQAWRRGGDPCAAAAHAAGWNGATLQACSRRGAVVSVRTACRIDSLFGRRLTVTATARAGPG